MRNIYIVFFYLLVLVIHLWGIYTGNEWISQLTKTTLMPVLISFFFWRTHSFLSGLKKWMVSALIFSWLGDILLMFVPSDPAFFLAGLSSFLIAHIFFVLFFNAIRIHEKIKGKLSLFLIVFIYYAGLMNILTPWLGDLKLPVRIYSVVICFMLMLAMHMLFIRNKKAGWRMFGGALLFVLSDSVLAIDKFYIPFTEAGIIIMFTYGLAQLFIVEGAIHYIRSGIGKKEG